MRRALTIGAAIGILGVLVGTGTAQDAPPPKLVLKISPDGWGPADPSDIQAVLQSAADSLLPQFRGYTLPVIEISHSEKDPITLFKRGPAGEIRVKLAVENRTWDRFSFQLAHELAHVFAGTEEYPNPNLWFEETLCEVSSLYVLGRMAETWKTRPPYKNWSDYAPKLKKYRDDRIRNASEKIPEGQTLRDWFRGKEPGLREDPHQRSVNLTIAVALLPLFDEAPDHWEAIKNLNTLHGDGTRTFSRYLGDWSKSVSEKHRDFIAKVAAVLGTTVEN